MLRNQFGKLSEPYLQRGNPQTNYHGQTTTSSTEKKELSRIILCKELVITLRSSFRCINMSAHLPLTV